MEALAAGEERTSRPRHLEAAAAGLHLGWDGWRGSHLGRSGASQGSGGGDGDSGLTGERSISVHTMCVQEGQEFWGGSGGGEWAPHN